MVTILLVRPPPVIMLSIPMLVGLPRGPWRWRFGSQVVVGGPREPVQHGRSGNVVGRRRSVHVVRCGGKRPAELVVVQVVALAGGWRTTAVVVLLVLVLVRHLKGVQMMVRQSWLKRAQRNGHLNRDSNDRSP